MLNYKYINPIRCKNGKLREWKDYDYLERLERKLDVIGYSYEIKDTDIEIKHKIVENERKTI